MRPATPDARRNAHKPAHRHACAQPARRSAPVPPLRLPCRCDPSCAAGTSECELELQDGADTDAFVPALLERYAALEKLAPRCAVALNGEYVTAPQLLKDRDELGLIPPLSGG